jgi:hypothetical protein
MKSIEELTIRIVGISSELCLTLDRIVNVEHFISERTHEPNVLRFWVKMWCSTHLCSCSSYILL